MEKNVLSKITKSLKNRGLIKTWSLSLYYVKIFIRNAYKKFKNNFKFYLVKRGSVDGYILRKIQGSKMILNLNDLGISKELALRGYHEKNSTEYIQKEVKKDMTVLEIGANIGYYTLLEVKTIGPGGHIYAFEPNPDNFHNLKQNIALNNLEDMVTLYPHAIGAETKEAVFYLADHGNLSSLIKREDNLVKYREIKTKIYRADEIMADKPFDYFRMDVEGYEVEVIKGMARILASGHAPRGMFVEIHSELLHKINYSAKDFITNLRKYGYEIKKSFYRGKKEISVNSTNEFLSHPNRERGYWETFFTKK